MCAIIYLPTLTHNLSTPSVIFGSQREIFSNLRKLSENLRGYSEIIVGKASEIQVLCRQKISHILLKKSWQVYHASNRLLSVCS